MEARQLRAVWLLGLCQCALWGALYYSFSVLLLPLADAMKQSRTAIAGGFSLALLISALVAPAVGRCIDRGQIVAVFRCGIGLSVVGLLLLANGSAVAAWVGWIGIGLASSMSLYEPAFALVIRSHADATRRMRALAIVTVLGGLASTLSAPALGLVIKGSGPAVALATCAVAVVAAGVLLECAVLPQLIARVGPVREAIGDGPGPANLIPLAMVFAVATMAGVGLTTLLIPALIEREMPAVTAALALGALGLAQLPGRIVLSGWTIRPAALTPVALLLQGGGLLLIAPTKMPLAGVLFGVALFGLGAGIQTVMRPWLVERLVGAASAGRWNGEVARIQGFARAAAPVVAVALAEILGSATVLLLGGLLVLGCLPSAARVART